MRKILAMILAFCTVFSSVCTIVLAKEQSLLAGTVSGNDAAGDTVSGGNADVAAPSSDENTAGQSDVGDGKNEDVSTLGDDDMFEHDGIHELPVNKENYHFWYAVDEKGIVITLVEPGNSDDYTVDWSEDVGEIVIPEQIEGVDGKVYRIGRNAFVNCSESTGSISLPDSITEIGDGAFWEVRGFSMTLPSGLKEVGDHAFAECNELVGELPAGLTKIGESAFDRCSGLSGSLVLSQGIKEIGSNAFYGCSGFSGELILPEGLEKIGYGAFRDCSGLTGSLKLPNGLKEIEDEAFGGCSGLSGTLDLPEGLLRIGNGVFSGCQGLCGELKLPESLEEIGSAPFSGYEYKDGNVTFVSCGFTGDLVIPDNVVKMNKYAFAKCENFSGSLILSANLTEIAEGAFFECSGLTGELKLPAGVTSIGEAAFCDCRNLAGDLVIPAGVESIGKEAFDYCRNLTGDLVIPASVERIGALAFRGCDSLSRDIYMTENVKYIENTSTGVSAFVRSYDANTGERITVADITIHAPRGSYAETYAIENGYSYTDDNGYVHKGTGNNNGQKPGTDDKTENGGNNSDNKDDNKDDGSGTSKPDGSNGGSNSGTSKPDSNGGNGSSGSNADTDSDDDDENNTYEEPSVAITNTTTVQIQVTTKPSDADKAAGVKDGEHLQVEVYGSADDSVLKALSKAAADMGATIAAVFNIDLKVLGANGNLIRKVSEPGSALTFTIPAPAGVDGNVYDFAVLRYHNGQITVLPDLDSDPATITFASNRFSVYAVVYGPKGSFAGKQASKDGVPKTGDKLPIAVSATATVIFAVLSCILGGQELLGKRAKRMRNR